jgi:hypothetical protein
MVGKLVTLWNRDEDMLIDGWETRYALEYAPRKASEFTLEIIVTWRKFGYTLE